MDNTKVKTKEQQAPVVSKSTVVQQGTSSAASAADKLKE